MRLRKSKMKQNKKGFTLIELVVVMCIIAILASALIPQISGYITEAKKMKVLDQSRTVVMAVDSYNLKNTVKLNDSDTIEKIKANPGVSKYLNEDVKLDNLKDTTTIKDCKNIVDGAEFTIDEDEKLASVIPNTKIDKK
ncbi:type II secretion system protein [uncultured Clostridium sp.]|uniref:type II secretion system protein n=1 Tax=uncultured Clostridium sp. TaxID=59620 RepID=UPI0025DB7467|nr:type II secretion system protein [uncultured Clostridium sp.]